MLSSPNCSYRDNSVASESTTNRQDEYAVTIAIDFGTTYSGCSYKYAHSNQIYDVVQWPKHSGFYAKVPSLLYYRTGTQRLLAWGDGAKRLSLQPGGSGTLIQQFKLWLLDDIDQRMLPPLLPGQTAVKVISDYLTLFHEHALNDIERTNIMGYPREKFRYCLTVPAIWNEKAKALMRQAIVEAGIINEDDPVHRLTLVSEPEAAALYCEKHSASWDMKQGSQFMVVDAGGGTVDLIIYEVEQGPEEGHRRLKEITRGYGGICGGAYIDNNMRYLLERKLGRHAQSMPSCQFENIMQIFIEEIKPTFCGDLDQYLPMPAGFDRARIGNIVNEDGCMRLTVDELKHEVFGPVFDYIAKLIDDQLQDLQRPVDGIFLVGGLGCSQYLYDVLSERFGARVSKIVMVPRADVAVARGALHMTCAQDIISSKIIQRTYGLCTSMLFDPALDPEDSAVITKDGVKRCMTRFDVIAFKGDRISPSGGVSRHFWVTYPKHTEATLYAYDGEGKAPRHITHPDIKKVARFPIRMPHLADVRPGDKVDVRIEFKFGSSELILRAFIHGQMFEFVSNVEP